MRARGYAIIADHEAFNGARLTGFTQAVEADSGSGRYDNSRHYHETVTAIRNRAMSSRKEQAQIMSDALVRYDEACKAIAQAKSVDEAKHIVDTSAALRAYARQAKNKQLEVDAAEIRMRAERRVGELIRTQKETIGLNGGSAGRGRPKLGGLKNNPPKNRPTLDDAGIDKNLANRARKLAAVPEKKFEQIVATWRDRIATDNERVTMKLVREAKPSSRVVTSVDESEIVEIKHRDCDISAIHPWDTAYAGNLLSRFLTTCFNDWWKADKEHLVKVLRRKLEWMEKQIGREA